MAALQPRAAYGGRCLTCGGAHALRPDAAALAAAREVDAAIRRHERLDWEAPGPGDPRFGIEYLDGRRAGGGLAGAVCCPAAPLRSRGGDTPWPTRHALPHLQ